MPGEAEYLPVRFTPLEVKEYTVSVPVVFDNGESKMITIKGSGLREEVKK